MSFLAQANSSNFGSMFLVLDPFDQRRGSPADTLRDDHGPAPQGVQAADQGRAGHRLRLVRRPRPGRRRRVQAGRRGPRQPRPGGTPGSDRRPDPSKLQDAARPGRRRPPSSAPRRPSFSSTSTAPRSQSLGVSFDDVNQTLSMYLGSLYVNSFNEFGRHWQVTIQAEGQFRNQIEDINLLQVRNKWGQMVPLGTAGQRPRGRRPDLGHALQPLHAPRRSPGTSSRASARATRSRRSTGWPADTLPLSMRTEWTELMFMQIRAGNTAIYVFALAAVSVFLALAALYESWSLPLAVILVVPLCLLCSVAGRALHGSRREHLRADRPGGAGRPGVQERDPDRRVRQAAAAGGHAAVRGDARGRAGSGSGRS